MSYQPISVVDAEAGYGGEKHAGAPGGRWASQAALGSWTPVRLTTLTTSALPRGQYNDVMLRDKHYCCDGRNRAPSGAEMLWRVPAMQGAVSSHFCAAARMPATQLCTVCSRLCSMVLKDEGFLVTAC